MAPTAGQESKPDRGLKRKAQKKPVIEQDESFDDEWEMPQHAPTKKVKVSGRARTGWLIGGLWRDGLAQVPKARK